MKLNLKRLVTAALLLSILVLFLPIVKFGRAAYNIIDILKMAHGGYKGGYFLKLLDVKELIEPPVNELLQGVSSNLIWIVVITAGMILFMHIAGKHQYFIVFSGIALNTVIVGKMTNAAIRTMSMVSQSVKKHFEGNLLMSKLSNGGLEIQMQAGAYLWCGLYMLVLLLLIVATVYHIKFGEERKWKKTKKGWISA